MYLCAINDANIETMKQSKPFSMMQGMCIAKSKNNLDRLDMIKSNMNNNIKTTELIRSSQSWDGVQLPDYPQGKPELTVLRMTFR